MANVNRIVGQNTYEVKVPVAANVKVEVGDNVFKDAAGNAIPASGVTWDTSADKTVSTNRSAYLGISMSQHQATELASTISVATEGFARIPTSGLTLASQVSNSWTIPKDAGGNYLANQLMSISGTTTGTLFTQLESLPTGAPSLTPVKVRFHGATSRNVFV